MNLLAILAAIGLEQWHAFRWRVAAERAYVGYARRLETALNGGTAGQGSVALALALGLPLLVAAAVWYAAARVHPLLGLAWNVVVLYALMDFRRSGHAVTAIIEALKGGDVATARRVLAAWRGGWTGDIGSDAVARLAVERGLADAYRQVFAVLFWFLMLPGPVGCALYRAAVLLAGEWRVAAPGDDATPITRSRAEFGKPARALLGLLDWMPARLTGLGFAIVGDFEDAAYCWRMQAKTWPEGEGGEPIGIVLASGAGALGATVGGPLADPAGEARFRPELGTGEPVTPEILPSAVGLVWRAVVLWLALVLLVTLASFAS